MKTLEELRTFCKGYVQGVLAAETDLSEEDLWIEWGGYDINLFGSHYTLLLSGTDRKALRVNAYKAGWKESLGDPIHVFTIRGEL